MAGDILGGFGPNSSQPQKPVAGKGGVMPGDTKDVNNYAPPCGPRNINDAKGPGLHGTNQGDRNTPVAPGGHSGSPGLGGNNYGTSGSQGRY